MLFRKISLFVFTLIIAQQLNAQDNSIKTSISGLFLGDYGLSYERILENSNSIQIKAAYMNPLKSPFISEKMLTPSGYTLQDYKGGFNLSFEYRFYMHKEMKLNGLYIAPYLRYYNQSGLYLDDIEAIDYNVDATVNTVGLGAQIGYQWLISERVTIDFAFFGAGLDWNNYKSIYTAINPPEIYSYNSIVDDVSAVFENINYLKNKLSHEVNEDNLTSKLPFLFPGFRMSLSVGIAF